MTYKHCCVVDKQGYYVDFVLVHLEEDQEGSIVERVDTHIMADGEKLLDAELPAGQFARPRWMNGRWTEGGTEEEIAAWEATKPVPEDPQPSQLELLAVELSMAMAAMQQQTDMAIAELTIAMAAGMEVSLDV